MRRASSFPLFVGLLRHPSAYPDRPEHDGHDGDGQGGRHHGRERRHRGGELRATHPGIHVTLLLPGVVATEFGLNSMGTGIVDNRKLPGARPVEAAAAAIVDVIENPRSEAYTSAFIADVIARYQREPDAFEAEIASRQH